MYNCVVALLDNTKWVNGKPKRWFRVTMDSEPKGGQKILTKIGWLAVKRMDTLDLTNKLPQVKT